MTTTPVQNPNRAALPPQNLVREIGLFERGVIAIKNFILEIFEKIVNFFVRIFRRGNVAPSTPLARAPVAAPAHPAPQPPAAPAAAAPQPPGQTDPLPVPVQDLLRDLRAWQEPTQLLARFERVTEEENRNEILGRIGRARGVGNLDAGLNRFWRNQEAVDAQFVEVGRAAVRENPRILIHDLTTLFPAR